MAGGEGSDTYIVDQAGDVVDETGLVGIDSVRTSLAAYALGANLENLVYTGAGAFAGTGNASANSITGGAGDDVLDGGAGVDTLTGGAGNDVYVVDDLLDKIVETSTGGDADEVRTSLAALTLATSSTISATWLPKPQARGRTPFARPSPIRSATMSRIWS
jgi:serralysin